ncbi:UDP-N-acetylglucosamine 1-carboxyvinyltransferase [Patescibacteria group bacterium]|nr:UDP-N-acetylglucosamine 1-carboxyvinyltransferase [Patescibacteria group bacterium]MBU1703046.1 UDP-N-acetylglucosamine 1-carboxyvinyltransferase [Patescibacteria group bacterium]MBU1953995.1 UDP-N-acetylglucosamine 1-carboxyvinyltransferase [Patescibacteria group bacterium]
MPNTSQKFVIEGEKTLSGTITVSGSKNAALPILCATLLTNEKSEIHGVPDIADIRSLLKIFEHLNVKTTFENGTVTVDPTGLNVTEIPKDLICSMRASILLMGPLLARIKEVQMPFPGGCVLGKRSVQAHTHVFQKLGGTVLDESQTLHVKMEKPKGATIIMPELSVTGTENALMLAAALPGTTQIRLAAAEPHVQDLCLFLTKMGARIDGIGTHFLTINGSAADENRAPALRGATHEITGDYLEAGTFAIAGLVTKSDITIKGIKTGQLDSFWEKLDEAGAKYELKPEEVRILPTETLKPIQNLRTAVYPSFPTDLQAPFAVLLTRAQGKSHIFETLFDGRLQYLYELEKMGAKVEMHNPHQATITGPTRLKGVPISSLDLRAGAAMVLAALCAEGTTEISNINYIDRGYENFEGKLRGLGASIKRIQS